MKLKTKITIFLVVCFIQVSVFSQNQKIAEDAVKDYLTDTSNSYVPMSFGKVFKQLDADDIQKELTTNQTVVYTIRHTYYIEGKLHEDVFFHLDDKMNIIGFLTNEQMMDLTMKQFFSSKRFMEILDSLEIDTNTIEKIDIEMDYEE